MSTKSLPLTIEQIQDHSRLEKLSNLKQSLEKVGIPINFTQNIEGVLWSKVSLTFVDFFLPPIFFTTLQKLVLTFVDFFV